MAAGGRGGSGPANATLCARPDGKSRVRLAGRDCRTSEFPVRRATPPNRRLVPREVLPKPSSGPPIRERQPDHVVPWTHGQGGRRGLPPPSRRWRRPPRWSSSHPCDGDVQLCARTKVPRIASPPRRRPHPPSSLGSARSSHRNASTPKGDGGCVARVIRWRPSRGARTAKVWAFAIRELARRPSARRRYAR